MTIEEQAEQIQQSYTQWHRMTTQPWRSAEDRQQALKTLKGQLATADRTLRLPTCSDTASARSKLILWVEIT